MSFCRNCGTEIDNNTIVCPKCGVSQSSINFQQPTDNRSGIGWGILSFFIPVAGLVLFLVWKDSRPRASKSAGIGALIGTILSSILGLIIILAGLYITWLPSTMH